MGAGMRGPLVRGVVGVQSRPPPAPGELPQGGRGLQSGQGPLASSPGRRTALGGGGEAKAQPRSGPGTGQELGRGASLPTPSRGDHTLTNLREPKLLHGNSTQTPVIRELTQL